MKKAIGALSFVVIFLLLTGMLNLFIVPQNEGISEGIKNQTRADVVYITDTFIINQTTIDPLTGERGKYGFDASVVVTSTGKLVVENATMYFLCDVNHRYNLTVEGSLYLYNATVTIGYGAIQPYYFFSLNIKGPGNGKVEITKSRMLFSGWFNITDKDGNVVIKDTTFAKMKHSSTDPNVPPYGPTVYLYNSKVYMMNVNVFDMRYSQSSGVGYIGSVDDSTGYTIDNTTGADINNFIKNPEAAYAHYWAFAPLKNIHIVTYYTNSSDYDQSSYLVFKYHTQEIGNFSLNGNGTIVEDIPVSSFNLGENEYMTANDFYNKIQNGEIKIYVTETTQGSVSISSISLGMGIENNLVEYGIESFSFNVIKSTLYIRNAYVDVDYESRDNLGTTHNMFYLSEGSKVYSLNLTVNDNGNSPREDTCFLMNDSISEVYILRYADIGVYFNNHPIDNLNVSALPIPSDINSDPTLKSKIQSVIDSYISETSVVSGMSLGQMSDDEVWDLTVDGRVLLPLLSDIINKTEEPNSKFIGIYNVSIHNDTTVFYTTQIGLNPYPWLLEENNTFRENIELPKYKDVDLAVQSITVDTSEPYLPGRDIQITVSIINNGLDTAEDSTLYIYINGNIYQSYSIGDVGGNAGYHETYVLPGSYFSSNGIYNISAIVTQIWDYDPENDLLYIDVKVGNIVVTEWNLESTIRYHHTQVEMNINSVYTWSSVNVSLYLDSTSNLINYTIVNLNSGITHVNFEWYISSSVSPGEHTLLAYIDGTVLIGSKSINVVNDINLYVASITVAPQEGFVEKDLTINAKIINMGVESPSTATIYIEVYDPYDTLIINRSFSYKSNQSQYLLTITPHSSGTYKVVVVITCGEDYDTTNNILESHFEVYPTPFSVISEAKNEYINGTDITVNITVQSEINASMYVNLYIYSWNIRIAPTEPANPMNISAHGTIHITFVITQNTYEKYLKGHPYIVVNYKIEIKSNRTGNAIYSFSAPSFIIKEKANFAVSSLSIKESGKEINKVAEGVIINITFEIRNVGGLPGNLTYVILDNDNPILWKDVGTLEPGNAVVIEYNYTVYGVEDHEIKIKANPNNTVEESNYGDNVISKDITVIVPEMKIIFSSYSEQNNEKVYVGDTLIVVVKVINVNATESQGKTVYMKNVTVTLNLAELGTYTAVTNEYGIASFNIKVERKGSYTPQLSLSYGGQQTEYTPQGAVISIQEKPFEIPWLWIIVIIIAAAIGGFFLYGYITFKKEAPEYMVCGNCGHLVPADAEKCPYCGVVFEKEKVKCPQCGSWIDEDSKFCPVCGTVFLPSDDPEYEKYVTLKENYEKYIGKYKEEAKKYIGEEYTEEEFYKWWKTHPEFISFLEWLKRQEEKIEGDTVKCPVCGAMNPKGAKICRVCGSPLPQEEVEEEAEEGRGEGEEEPKAQPTPLPPEEIERLKRPGVVTVEEWAERKGKETEKTEEKEKTAEEEKEEKPVEVEKTKEEKPEEKKEEKPVVKKKVIKKVIAVKEEKEES